jgi:hypothetical protein
MKIDINNLKVAMRKCNKDFGRLQKILLSRFNKAANKGVWLDISVQDLENYCKKGHWSFERVMNSVNVKLKRAKDAK